MTGIDITATASGPAPPPPAPRSRSRSRWRLPASRGGIAWMVVVIIIGIFLAAQFGRQVYANWEIGQRAAAIEAEIAHVEAQNTELERELAYVQSPAYFGPEARRLGNLGSAGEEALIIQRGAEEPLPEELAAAIEPPKALIEQWIDLFFGTGT